MFWAHQRNEWSSAWRNRSRHTPRCAWHPVPAKPHTKRPRTTPPGSRPAQGQRHKMITRSWLPEAGPGRGQHTAGRERKGKKSKHINTTGGGGKDWGGQAASPGGGRGTTTEGGGCGWKGRPRHVLRRGHVLHPPAPSVAARLVAKGVVPPPRILKVVLSAFHNAEGVESAVARGTVLALVSAGAKQFISVLQGDARADGDEGAAGAFAARQRQ